jgi:hypothetical protein
VDRLVDSQSERPGEQATARVLTPTLSARTIPVKVLIRSLRALCTPLATVIGVGMDHAPDPIEAIKFPMGAAGPDSG